MNRDQELDSSIKFSDFYNCGYIKKKGLVFGTCTLKLKFRGERTVYLQLLLRWFGKRMLKQMGQKWPESLQHFQIPARTGHCRQRPALHLSPLGSLLVGVVSTALSVDSLNYQKPVYENVGFYFVFPQLKM